MRVVNIIVYDEIGHGRVAIFVDQIVSFRSGANSNDECLIDTTNNDRIQVRRSFDEIEADLKSFGK